MSSQGSAINLDDFRVPEDRLTCAPFSLGFQTTDDIGPLGDDVFIGQARAEAALRKGFGTQGNMFVMGLPSINSAFLRRLRREAGASMPAEKVCDTVCVHNFENPQKPRFLHLPKGQALQFARDVGGLLDVLKEAIPKTLESDRFRAEEQEIRERANQETRDVWSVLEKEVASISIRTQGLGELGYILRVNQGGTSFFLVVLAQDSRPITEEEYSGFAASEVAKCEKRSKYVLSRLQGVFRAAEKRGRDVEKAVEEKQREFVSFLFLEEAAGILSDYGEIVSQFMDGLRGYTLGHIKDFLPRNGETPAPTTYQPPPDPFLPFKINVFVDNSKTVGVPVIDRRNADYQRLFGEVEHGMGPSGMPLGGHTMVRAGLISEANHGVLVLSAEDVLLRPGMWERIKAVLETKRLDIERDTLGWYGSGSTKPETLSVDVKLVLVGTRFIYGLLTSPLLKHQFDEIFHTTVEFSPEAPRSDEVIGQLAGLIRSFCDTEQLPSVRADGVEEFLTYLARVRENQDRFLLDARSLKDLLQEASWLAGESTVITGGHVRQAIHNKVDRIGFIRDMIHEQVRNGDIILTLSGSEVGQVNGVVVFEAGDLSFGRPSRITVTTQMAPLGKDGIVNIERESDMSGKTHSKGVLILGGHFGARFGQKTPLAFTAKIAFEQSYAGVDGDSASSAEWYGILSSLSGVPVRQDIVVTGSMNQKGEIQPIGGVNQKIEGVFDICSMFGLTGTQGVMIPHQNIKNLVLREDVIKAIKAGQFHVWAVKTVEEGIAILTGMAAGERDPVSSKHPEGSLYRLVDDRLVEYLADFLESSKPRSPKRKK